MTTPPIRLPSGVRDFLPRAAARRRSLAEKVMTVFEAWGYARIITPVFECADVLERGLGAGARAAAIRFVEPGTGEVVALRPDITPQIARVVATRIAERRRADPPLLRGRGHAARRRRAGQREILQAGIELSMRPSRDGDAEVLAVAAAALAQLRAARDAHRRRPRRAACVRARRRARSTSRARAARRRARPQGSRGPARCGARVARRRSRRSPRRSRPCGDRRSATLERALALPWPADVQGGARSARATCSRRSPSSRIHRRRALTIDLGDLRGFDYYTGVRFAAYAGGAPDAVLRGGRYDELIARYGRAAQATGFAIDLEAVAQAQRAIGVAAPRAALGVATTAAGSRARALRCARRRVRVVQRRAPADWRCVAARCRARCRDRRRSADRPER